MTDVTSTLWGAEAVIVDQLATRGPERTWEAVEDVQVELDVTVTVTILGIVVDLVAWAGVDVERVGRGVAVTASTEAVLEQVDSNTSFLSGGKPPNDSAGGSGNGKETWMILTDSARRWLRRAKPGHPRPRGPPSDASVRVSLGQFAFRVCSKPVNRRNTRGKKNGQRQWPQQENGGSQQRVEERDAKGLDGAGRQPRRGSSFWKSERERNFGLFKSSTEAQRLVEEGTCLSGSICCCATAHQPVPPRQERWSGGEGKDQGGRKGSPPSHLHFSRACNIRR